MKFRFTVAALVAMSVCGFWLVVGVHSSLALAPGSDQDIIARTRLFPDVGPGIKAMKRDSRGRYFFLLSADHAIRIYTASETFIGQVPAISSGKAAISDGEDFDVDSKDRVFVADRDDNAVKVYAADGNLSFVISAQLPSSVAVLASGQIAVAGLKSRDLVTVYDAQGKYVREFGDLSDLADHEELNRFLNIGRLATDLTGHVYYAFTYFPEPTVRKYDAFGLSSYQISLHTLDVYPSAQAERRDISRIDQQSTLQPLPAIINAIAIDPQTEEVWISIGDYLMKFDQTGTRVASYHTLTAAHEGLAASSILIEPRRILLADDPHGVFEFARPDLPPTAPAKTK